MDYLKVAPLVPKVNRQKTKKIVIVKRRKPESNSKSKYEDDDDRIVEKRTIKRRIKVTMKGNNATNQILQDDMKDFNL